MIDAKEYGKALFLLAEEEGIADTVRDDVLCVRELTLMHPEYLRLLDTPALTKAERLGSIDESMATVHAYLRSAIKMLSEKHRDCLHQKKLLHCARNMVSHRVISVFFWAGGRFPGEGDRPSGFPAAAMGSQIIASFLLSTQYSIFFIIRQEGL